MSATRSSVNPTLVLLPGMDGTGCLFAPFVAVVGDLFPLRVVSFPGLTSYKQLQDWVGRSIADLDNYVLVAESFSGPIAARIAGSSPPGLQALVLCASFVSAPIPKQLRWVSSIVRPWNFSLAPADVRARILLGSSPSPSLRALFDETLSAVSYEELALRAAEILRVDAAEDLAAFEGPVLYIRATQDRLVGPRAVRDVCRAKPETVVRELESPHLVLQTHPESCLELIASELPAN